MQRSLLFRTYLQTLRGNPDLGNATEHTHRPVLKGLLEAVDIGIDAVNEPGRIERRAPDFIVSGKGRERATVAYLEAKDIGVDLSDIERDSDRRNPSTSNGRQLKRCRESLPTMALSDYVEFRRYADGEPVRTARLAVDE